ncbi:hypothetical protein [Anaerococcus nagyae]|uniref:hypothetical protein n=1 Tax=Anaerococcus nagyae TaxID=1755241 RepID=UPI00324EBCAF
MTLKILNFNKKQNGRLARKQAKREEFVQNQIRKNREEAEKKARMKQICDVRRYCFGE